MFVYLCTCTNLLSGVFCMNISTAPFSARLAYTLLSIALLLVGAYWLQSLLIPVVFAFIFSIMLHPLVARLERWRLPKVLAILLALLAAIVVISMLVSLAVNQIADFRAQFPVLQQRLQAFVEHMLILIEQNFHITRTHQLLQIQKHAEDLINEGGVLLGYTLSGTLGFLSQSVLVVLYVFFLLYYRAFFRQFLVQVFHKTSEDHINTVIEKIYKVIQNYLVGLLMVMGIVAVLDSIGLLILNIEYAIFFSVLAAILMVIPYIGMFSVMVLAVLVTLVTKESPWYALGTALVMLGIQALEGNVITPYILGSKVSINPFVAIVVLVLGELLWGIPGMILALPLTAILKVIVDMIEPLKPLGFVLGSPEVLPKAAPVRTRKKRLRMSKKVEG